MTFCIGQNALKKALLEEMLNSMPDNQGNHFQENLLHQTDNTTYVNLTLSGHVVNKQVAVSQPGKPTPKPTISTTSTTTMKLHELKNNITFINLTLVGQVIHKQPEKPTSRPSTPTTSSSTTLGTTPRAATTSPREPPTTMGTLIFQQLFHTSVFLLD